jgi:hypothetical protein
MQVLQEGPPLCLVRPIKTFWQQPTVPLAAPGLAQGPLFAGWCTKQSLLLFIFYDCRCICNWHTKISSVCVSVLVISFRILFCVLLYNSKERYWYIHLNVKSCYTVVVCERHSISSVKGFVVSIHVVSSRFNNNFRIGETSACSWV